MNDGQFKRPFPNSTLIVHSSGLKCYIFAKFIALLETCPLCTLIKSFARMGILHPAAGDKEECVSVEIATWHIFVNWRLLKCKLCFIGRKNEVVSGHE